MLDGGSTLAATDPARPDEGLASGSAPVTADDEPDLLLEAGQRAGDFVIEAVIGRGTFGTVYRAAHGVIGRRAAVKVLRRRFAEARDGERFVDEARLVARLRHPNVVDVFTFGQLEDGRFFQVMDLIEGPTLAELLRERGALPLAQALPILRGVASALDAIHESGIAHRDLKPANVVLERRGDETIAKLIDFGIAEVIDPDADPTTRRAPSGTPRYMAPEQCRGGPVDARADAYAFGLLAYEVLTGHPPFAGADALDLMIQHTSEMPAPPSRARPSLSPGVDAQVLALLDKDPDRRPRQLSRVVDHLEAAASARAPAGPVVAAVSPRRRGGVWIAAAAAAVVAATSLWVARQERPPPIDAPSAEVAPAGSVTSPPRQPTAAPAGLGGPDAPDAPDAPTRVAQPADAPSAAPRARVAFPPATSTPRSVPSGSKAPPRGLEDPENPFAR